MVTSRTPGRRLNPEPDRPEPAKLLARLKAQELRARNTRGGLRIYLGAAPGVGKTFAMLNEARRRQSRGTDVVIGYVETWNRPMTVQATEGLEVVPRRTVEYRGATLEEMDLDAVIARRPAVVLVDELAHTNAPGSRHEKRWQDVEEIRDAGITVIATLNIQHLESLKERVEQIAGIAVRETVPDSVVENADDVELIDIAPEALRRRMIHGNIYPPERAKAALARFFRPGNLAALREMALRRTMEQADHQLNDYMDEHGLSGWTIDERLVVCIDHRPLSETLLRRGWHLASRFKCPWTAVHIKHAGKSESLSEQDKAALARHRQMAADLGAEVEEIEAGDIAEALSRYVISSCATQIIIGHSQRSYLFELLHGSVVQQLLRRLPNVDVHVVAERETKGEGK